MNSRRDTEGGLKNQSRIASLASYIDFYRPKYAFVENVVAMASGKINNPFHQFVCAMVGIGYQVRVMKIDASSCGSPQSRSRLIISLAAPGLTLPPYPAMSHDSPSRRVKSSSLGKTASGDKFGLAKSGPTTFPFVTAAKATEDLPDIGDAQTKTCIPFPDHVVNRSCPKEMRARIKLIPRYPRGLNFSKSIWMNLKGFPLKTIYNA